MHRFNSVLISFHFPSSARNGVKWSQALPGILGNFIVKGKISAKRETEFLPKVAAYNIKDGQKSPQHDIINGDSAVHMMTVRRMCVQVCMCAYVCMKIQMYKYSQVCAQLWEGTSSGSPSSAQQYPGHPEFLNGSHFLYYLDHICTNLFSFSSWTWPFSVGFEH